MTRSDARKRREEAEPRDQVVLALEFLADAIANAVRAGLIATQPTATEAFDMKLRFDSRTGPWYAKILDDLIDTRLEPF